MSTNRRLGPLRDSLEEKGWTVFWSQAGRTVDTYRGLPAPRATFMVTATDAVLATDFRYIEQAGQQRPGSGSNGCRASQTGLPNWPPRSGRRGSGSKTRR